MIAAGLYAALALFVLVIGARVVRDCTKPLPPHRRPEVDQ